MFGIRLIQDDGTVKYVSSTRGSPGLHDDINHLAFLNKQETAEKMVRKYRRDGWEIDGEFDVIKIQVVETDRIKIEYPPIKAGYVLAYTEGSGERYFTGTQKLEIADQHLRYMREHELVWWKRVDIRWATGFKTEKMARSKLDQICHCIDLLIGYNKDEINKLNQRISYRSQDRTYLQRQIDNYNDRNRALEDRKKFLQTDVKIVHRS